MASVPASPTASSDASEDEAAAFAEPAAEAPGREGRDARLIEQAERFRSALHATTQESTGLRNQLGHARQETQRLHQLLKVSAEQNNAQQRALQASYKQRQATEAEMLANWEKTSADKDGLEKTLQQLKAANLQAVRSLRAALDEALERDMARQEEYDALLAQHSEENRAQRRTVALLRHAAHEADMEAQALRAENEDLRLSLRRLERLARQPNVRRLSDTPPAP